MGCCKNMLVLALRCERSSAARQTHTDISCDCSVFVQTFWVFQSVTVNGPVCTHSLINCTSQHLALKILNGLGSIGGVVPLSLFCFWKNWALRGQLGGGSGRDKTSPCRKSVLGFSYGRWRLFLQRHPYLILFAQTKQCSTFWYSNRCGQQFPR